MNTNEKLLCEAVESFLSGRGNIGAPGVPEPPDNEVNLVDKHFALREETIYDLFAKEIVDLNNYDTIMASFKRALQLKYANIPSGLQIFVKDLKSKGAPKDTNGFWKIFESDLRSRAVDKYEISACYKALEKVRNSLEDTEFPSFENDHISGDGYHPDLKGILDASTPETYKT